MSFSSNRIFTYVPLKAVKGQVVADFLVEHTLPKEVVAYVGIQPWKLFFDGSSHKKGSGIGMLIISPRGIPTKFMFRIRENCSNNETEYEALISGLEILLALGAKNVVLKGDSELIIKQLTKEYKCVSENLAKYYVKAISLLAKFDQAGVSHIPSINNQEANELAQIASGYMVDKDRLEELIKVKEKLNPSDHDILAIDNMGPNDWRKPIVEYLQNPIGRTDRKVKYMALSYVIIGNELFKKNADGTLLKSLSKDDAFVAISTVHDGLCGAHQAGIKMKWLLFRQGMYWPTIMKDCIEYAKGCQDCQKHVGIQHVPANELHLIIKPWSFRGWALDLIGEINPSSSRQRKYIIVAIDYFTKWVEAIPLQNVTQDTMIDFIQNHIVYRFGLPKSLTTDQGTIFVGRKVASFAES
ncbi:uncharacterized protein LOC130736477 [Lotus japonicus]|uniref:uncharacterized protein LOC130736477 n=1 Tax=Lotus japonicus TaxID=34305 RepID=UPI00258531F5|nr:uncharacterized protein LOC130736477 [Lotus japonicus]